MKRYDTIIRGGTLVFPDSSQVADLAVTDGRIAEWEPELAADAWQEIDATGLHIFPGVIDAHVHFNEPGRSEWEGIASGTQALAAGGATTYFDMPLNSHPPTVDAAAFDLKFRAAEAASLVDFALWGGLVPGNLEHLEALYERGAIGFKAFMSNSGIDDFSAVDDLTLYEGMREVARLGSIVAVHAENDNITGLLARRAVAAGKVSARDYLQSRPVIAELEAINRAIFYAAETGCRLHIVHVSTGRGVRIVAEARACGIDVTCETCPHYLVLTEDDLERLGAIAKCAPPLRPQTEQDELWSLLATGTLPMVASDHSPAPASMKTGQDFFKIWGGISGCQSLLELLLTAGYAERGIPLGTIANATSSFVAERFGLTPVKGSLAPGTDADLAFVDLSTSYVLEEEYLFYTHRHSPFVGRTMQGRVVRTLVRGLTVFAWGEIVSTAMGRLVRPQNRNPETKPRKI